MEVAVARLLLSVVVVAAVEDTMDGAAAYGGTYPPPRMAVAVAIEAGFCFDGELSW